MKNSMIQCLTLCLLPIFGFAQKSTSIFFDSKQTVLTAEAKSQLIAFVDDVKPLTINKVSIMGFADAAGSDKLNQDLSEQRAAVVKSFLVEKGMNPTLISAVGRGKIGADSDKNRSRRVDVFVEFTPKTAPAVATTPSKPIPNITALYQALGTPIQTFKISTNRDTLLRGAKGTAIFVPKNAFEDVPINAVVDFRLKEAYSTADILGDNLNTTSGNQILQTGGMIYTDAQVNGKAVQLKSDLLVSFASTESRQEGMKIYSGVRNKQQNGKIDWQLATNEVEETVAYMFGESNSPFLMRNGKKGIAKFAEWVDVSSCGAYFKNGTAKYKPNQEPNTTCTTILTRVDAQPDLKTKTIEEVHRLVFSDMYSFYKVETLAELQKQDGTKWDSLLLVREKMYDLTTDGDARRKLWEENKKEEDRKNAIIWAEQERRNNERLKTEKFFPIKSLGWTNCDRINQVPNAKPCIVTADIPAKDNYQYSVIITFPKLGMTAQGNPNKEEQISFGMLPKDLDGYMIGMKTENNQPYLAIQKIKTDNMKVNLEYKAVTVAEIKQAFSELK
jgi:OmpA family